MSQEVIQNEQLAEARQLEEQAKLDIRKGCLTGLIAATAIVLVTSNLFPEQSDIETGYQAFSLAITCLSLLPAFMSVNYFISSLNKKAQANEIRFNAQPDEPNQRNLLN